MVIEIDPRILRLHLEISSVPQMQLNEKTLRYFWYSIASCIAVHRTEWLTDAMLKYISEQEKSDGD
jgi:hypothetical protein